MRLWRTSCSYASGLVSFSQEVTVSLEGEPRVISCRMSQKFLGFLWDIPRPTGHGNPGGAMQARRAGPAG